MLDYEEFVKSFEKYYEEGYSTTEICNMLGENRNRGYKLLDKLKLSSNKNARTINKEQL